MLIDVILLIVSLGLILLAAVLFTNAIELFGDRLNLHQGAVGSILAAIGTALPETIIPIIAIVGQSLSGKATNEGTQVAIGAIAGAPFMLGTLAFFITGLAVVVYALRGMRPRTMNIDPSVLTRDLTFFVLIYGAAVATTFAHEILWLKVAVAIGLLLSYGYYLKRTLASEAVMGEEFEPLMFHRWFKVPPSTGWITVQLVASLALMLGSAHLFVHYTEATSRLLGVPALILSLIITPIATELPEKFNSVIWIGKRKDILALGNITGAMVFQSCVPVVFGMIFTHWDLQEQGGITLVSALLAFGSALLMLAYVKIRKTMNPWVLLTGGALYGVFLAYLIVRWDVISRLCENVAH